VTRTVYHGGLCPTGTGHARHKIRSVTQEAAPMPAEDDRLRWRQRAAALTDLEVRLAVLRLHGGPCRVTAEELRRLLTDVMEAASRRLRELDGPQTPEGG
jgi:hypothetical protein